MADGKAFIGRERSAVLTNLTAQPKYTLLKAAATQGQLTVAGANEEAVAILAEDLAAVSAAREVKVIDLVPGSVVPLLAATAVGRQTSTLQTEVVPVAAGECDDLPTDNGTYYVIGKVDYDSPAATTSGGGDVIYVKVQPRKVTVPSTEAGIAAPESPEQGDVLYYDGSKYAGLAHGSDHDVLVTQGNGANPKWLGSALHAENPASQARGDVFFRGASVLERLAAGTAGKVLTTGGAGADPSWADAVNSAFPASQARGDVFVRGASTIERLAAGTKGQFLCTQGAAAEPKWASPLVVLTAAITDATAGVGSTVFWTYDLPAGISAVIVDVGFSALTVGAAGATIDVLEAGTTILNAPIAAAVGEVKGVLADTAIAAGATLTAKYTTGADSGAIGNGMLTILCRLVDGN